MIALRSLMFVATFYLWSAMAALAMLPLLVAPRRWMVKAMVFWALVVIALVRAICGVRLEFRGREHLPSGSNSIVASAITRSEPPLALSRALVDYAAGG